MTIYRVIAARVGRPPERPHEYREETFTGRLRAWSWSARKWLAGWRIVAVYPVGKR